MMTKLRFSLLAAAAMTMCACAADVRPTQGSPAGAGVVDPSMAPGHTQVIDGLTLAFDPSFTGESGGEGRFMASPDFGTEDFSAAVDYLMQIPSVS